MTHRALKHPGRWIWLPLLVLIAIGLARLRFDAEVFDLLPSDLPVVQGLQLYQEHFANARELIVTLQATEAEQVEEAARSIADQSAPAHQSRGRGHLGTALGRTPGPDGGADRLPVVQPATGAV